MPFHLTGGSAIYDRTYFEIKDETEPEGGGEDCDEDDGCTASVTPKPTSLVLLETGLVFLSGLLWRQLGKKSCS